MAETTRRLPQPIIDLYDEYTHAPLDRRTFLDRLAVLAGGSAAAYALLPVLENNYALAQMVAADDARLTAEEVSIPVPEGRQPVSAYAVRPAEGSDALPAVIVIHENRGLNPHIRDVARRVALAGYVAVAPDFLTSAGGTPEDEDRARDLIGQLDPAATLAEALAVAAYVREGRPDVTGKVGTIGFCWGGALVNQMAVNDPLVTATVSYYGRQPTAEETKKISAPIMLHYASLDDRINAGIPPFTAAMVEAGIPYTLHMYQDVNHAFHNDTNGARYDKAAADLSWQRTLEFLDRHLKA